MYIYICCDVCVSFNNLCFSRPQRNTKRSLGFLLTASSSHDLSPLTPDLNIQLDQSPHHPADPSSSSSSRLRSALQTSSQTPNRKNLHTQFLSSRQTVNSCFFCVKLPFKGEKRHPHCRRKQRASWEMWSLRSSVQDVAGNIGRVGK